MELRQHQEFANIIVIWQSLAVVIIFGAQMSGKVTRLMEEKILETIYFDVN